MKVLFCLIVLWSSVALAATGHTTKFGSSYVTTWNNGRVTTVRPFGGGYTTTDAYKGKTITGYTHRFGNSLQTQWSNGRTTTTRKFGNGYITEER